MVCVQATSDFALFAASASLAALALSAVDRTALIRSQATHSIVSIHHCVGADPISVGECGVAQHGCSISRRTQTFCRASLTMATCCSRGARYPSQRRYSRHLYNQLLRRPVSTSLSTATSLYTSQPCCRQLMAASAFSTTAPLQLPHSLRALCTSDRSLPSTSPSPTSATSLLSSSSPSLFFLPSRHASIHVTDTTAAEFNEEFDHLAETIQARIDSPDIDDTNLDLSYSNGVLSLRTTTHGTFVLNQHGVTRQVWLSSPLSGPSKYNWHRGKVAAGGKGSGVERKGQWCNERDAESDLMRLLEREFSVVFDKDVKFDQPF